MIPTRRSLLPLIISLCVSAGGALAADEEPAATVAAAVARLRAEDASYADWEAVLAAGKAAVPELQKLLKDPSDLVRSRAAVLLYRLGEASALDSLAALLDSKDEDARREAAAALQAFIGPPMGLAPGAPTPDREKALAAWQAWWKANRADALKTPPMSVLNGRILTVAPTSKLVGISLTARHGAKPGMRLNVMRGTAPVCLIEIVMAGAEASVARIVELSEHQPPKVGDRVFWISR
jgi:hypothetical protein